MSLNSEEKTHVGESVLGCLEKKTKSNNGEMEGSKLVVIRPVNLSLAN